jgi:hypothetical protein
MSGAKSGKASRKGACEVPRVVWIAPDRGYLLWPFGRGDGRVRPDGKPFMPPATVSFPKIAEDAAIRRGDEKIKMISVAPHGGDRLVENSRVSTTCAAQR